MRKKKETAKRREAILNLVVKNLKKEVSPNPKKKNKSLKVRKRAKNPQSLRNLKNLKNKY